MHIDSDHGNVRYSCNQCDFKAKWKQSFKEHIDSVRENVQYSCNQCDCKVTTKIYLKRHIDTVHKDLQYSWSLVHVSHPAGEHQLVQFVCHIGQPQALHPHREWRLTLTYGDSYPPQLGPYVIKTDL